MDKLLTYAMLRFYASILSSTRIMNNQDNTLEIIEIYFVLCILFSLCLNQDDYNMILIVEEEAHEAAGAGAGGSSCHH